jgi:hypothetical protein
LSETWGDLDLEEPEVVIIEEEQSGEQTIGFGAERTWVETESGAHTTVERMISSANSQFPAGVNDGRMLQSVSGLLTMFELYPQLKELIPIRARVIWISYGRSWTRMSFFESVVATVRFRFLLVV